MWYGPTKAELEYDGPEELRPFASISPYVGELAISFSRIERRVTWAIESLLGSTRDEAHEMEDFVMNFSARIKFLELCGLPVARETSTEEQFSVLIDGIRAANRFRNLALHNAFAGIRRSLQDDGTVTLGVTKGRYDKKLEKRSYTIFVSEFREKTQQNFSLCTDIQRWVLTVRPNAENRVP